MKLKNIQKVATTIFISLILIFTGCGGGGSTDSSPDIDDQIPSDIELIQIEIDSPETNIAAGYSIQISATGIFSDGSQQNITESVTWESSDINLASINNESGSKGLMMGITAGDTVTISATDPTTSLTDETELTITMAVLESISISPIDASISLGDIKEYTSTGTFSDGSQQNITGSVTWTSSNNDVTTISNDPPNTGKATSLNEGTVTITATYPSSGISAGTYLTINEAIVVENIVLVYGWDACAATIGKRAMLEKAEIDYTYNTYNALTKAELDSLKESAIRCDCHFNDTLLHNPIIVVNGTSMMYPTLERVQQYLY